MLVIFPLFIHTIHVTSGFTPLLAFCLCMVTYFYAELAFGLVVRGLRGNCWVKRGIPVARWCLDLYFCGVHTQILLCCNIIMISMVRLSYSSYMSKRSKSAPIRNVVSIVRMKSAHEAFYIIRNVYSECCSNCLQCDT
ncbi:hypothetical protein BDR07DRAFT_200566 [Suillus spraguei]|nr:hypothetical protein BDR07DRAFT_200566 [Suillus spraguei]